MISFALFSFRFFLRVRVASVGVDMLGDVGHQFDHGLTAVGVAQHVVGPMVNKDRAHGAAGEAPVSSREKRKEKEKKRKEKKKKNRGV